MTKKSWGATLSKPVAGVSIEVNPVRKVRSPVRGGRAEGGGRGTRLGGHLR